VLRVRCDTVSGKQIILWIIAILVVNITWAFVTDSEASYEINSKDQTEEQRDIDIADFFGMTEPIPARIEMTFYPSNTGESNYSFFLTDGDDVVTQGSGIATNSEIWVGELSPGTFEMSVDVSNGITADQTMYTQPFKPYQISGHIVVSIALVAVSFAEVGVRAFIQQKQQVKVNSTPTTSIENNSLPQSSATVYDEEDMSPWRDPIVL
jgi:hypothetical protein